MTQRILLFDGDCALCHWCVQWCIRAGAGESGVKFAPLGGNTALALRHTGIQIPASRDAIVFVDADKVTAGAFAFTALARYFRFPFNLIQLVGYLPVALLETVYGLIGSRRRKFFGNSSQRCLVLEPHKHLILD
jgi:predicted DCC family thiol-disulfide oxidoreductase YuxK